MAGTPPILREEIPITQSRNKSLIKVFATFGGYIPDPSDPANVPDLSSMAQIGSVARVMVNPTRNAAERRELNTDTLGQILEMIPGLTSFEVTMSYIYLYRASFMEAVGFAGHSLEFNSRPILFALQMPSPTPDTIPEKTLLLRDCWLKANPIEFNVEEKDDLRITQEVGMACGGIIEVPLT